MGEIKKVLTIAGSDSSGGAGIQADIKTITAHKMYAMSVITALTAQNTTGVSAIHDVPPEFIGQQLDSVFTDIRPDAVKIGMVSNAAAVRVIAEKLAEYRAENIVIDPVMTATSGSALISGGAAAELVRLLFPLGAVITPNLPEAGALCGFAVESEEDMRRAAEKIGADIPAAVLVKGGHLTEDAADLLYLKGKFTRFASKRVNTKNTHGTGCTLSSAIACGLAEGLTAEESVKRAKEYVTGAIENSLSIGKGCGPLNHMYGL